MKSPSAKDTVDKISTKWYDFPKGARETVNIKLGDFLTEKISCTGETKRGEVVYIHPEKYYYVVEFRYFFGSFREAYLFPVPPITEQKAH